MATKKLTYAKAMQNVKKAMRTSSWCIVAAVCVAMAKELNMIKEIDSEQLDKYRSNPFFIPACRYIVRENEPKDGEAGIDGETLETLIYKRRR